MSKRPPSTLHDLCELYGGGHMLLRCRACGRTRIYQVREIRDLFRTRRQRMPRRRLWDDRWRTLPDYFFCALCGGRPEHPQWIEGAVPADQQHLQACLAPFGIDARAWALALPEDRARLIKKRR